METKKRSKLWIGLAIAIVVLAGAGYLVYKNIASADMVTSGRPVHFVINSKYTLQQDDTGISVSGNQNDLIWKVLDPIPVGASFDVGIHDNNGKRISKNVIWGPGAGSAEVAASVLKKNAYSSWVDITSPKTAAALASPDSIRYTKATVGTLTMTLVFSAKGMAPNTEFDTFTNITGGDGGVLPAQGNTTNAIFPSGTNWTLNLRVWFTKPIDASKFILTSTDGLKCRIGYVEGTAKVDNCSKGQSWGYGNGLGGLEVAWISISQDHRKVDMKFFVGDNYHGTTKTLDSLKTTVEGFGSRDFIAHFLPPSASASTSATVVSTSTATPVQTSTSATTTSTTTSTSTATPVQTSTGTATVTATK